MKHLFLFFCFSLLIACSSEQKNSSSQKPEQEDIKKKTVKEFALEYCNCMHSEEDPTHCQKLLHEFQQQFGSKNKEAEIEFSKAMQNCL